MKPNTLKKTQDVPLQRDPAEWELANLPAQLYKTLVLLGAEHDLLGIIGSWGDGMSEEDVISGVSAWNSAAFQQLKERIEHYEISSHQLGCIQGELPEILNSQTSAREGSSASQSTQHHPDDRVAAGTLLVQQFESLPVAEQLARLREQGCPEFALSGWQSSDE